MNTKQFYENLSKTKHKYKWSRGKYSNNEIIGVIRRGPWKGNYCCPITAVCLDTTGEFFSFTDYENAAKAIKLTIKAAKVAEAADNPPEDLDRKELREIRQNLLTSLGFVGE